MTLIDGALPIIVAPMAGGPSTPALVAAVGDAGAMGFVAGGYLTPEALDRQLDDLERRTDRPYGVNLFVPSPRTTDPAPLRRYRRRLEPVAAAAGVALGEPRWDDDHFDAKVQVVCRHRPAAVSFTFGLPSEAACAALRRACGALLIATVTSPAEAAAARDRGLDALCVQGAEAGAHRGVFRDDVTHPAGGPLIGRMALLRQVRQATTLPVIATGGIMDGGGVREVLAAGAVAAQLGTAFLCCPEAGTSATHRRALLEGRYVETVVTRAFTGRPARGLNNDFARRFTPDAPAGYPEVHHLTRPLRSAAAAAGDPENLHLWAGTGWRSVTEEPAAALVARLDEERRRGPGGVS